MKFPDYDELMMKIVFFIAGLYILVKIVFPIYSYSYVFNSNINDKSKYFEQILSKANETIFEALPQDSSKYKFSSLFFSYLTGIDYNEPLSYITSTVPMLSIANKPATDLSNIGPITVIPSTETVDRNKPPSTKTKTTTPNKKVDTKPTTQNVVKPVSQPVKKENLNIDKPEVLVLHTHTTESYNPDKKASNFSSNLEITVTKVGDSLVNTLEDTYGISTVHDTSIHDLPTRSGAYDRSRPSVIAYLKKYPSIRLIIDLHRDGDVSRTAETAIINNTRYARVMLVSGIKFKNHEKYNKSTINFENVFDHLYPGFSRGIDYKNSTYNQDLNPNMILLEVGSNENSLDEAVRTSTLIAKVVATYLK